MTPEEIKAKVLEETDKAFGGLSRNLKHLAEFSIDLTLKFSEASHEKEQIEPSQFLMISEEECELCKKSNKEAGLCCGYHHLIKWAKEQYRQALLEKIADKMMYDSELDAFFIPCCDLENMPEFLEVLRKSQKFKEADKK